MKEHEEVLCHAYAVEPWILCIRSQKVILDADLESKMMQVHLLPGLVEDGDRDS